MWARCPWGLDALGGSQLSARHPIPAWRQVHGDRAILWRGKSCRRAVPSAGVAAAGFSLRREWRGLDHGARGWKSSLKLVLKAGVRPSAPSLASLQAPQTAGSSERVSPPSPPRTACESRSREPVGRRWAHQLGLGAPFPALCGVSWSVIGRPVRSGRRLPWLLRPRKGEKWEALPPTRTHPKAEGEGRPDHPPCVPRGLWVLPRGSLQTWWWRLVRDLAAPCLSLAGGERGPQSARWPRPLPWQPRAGRSVCRTGLLVEGGSRPPWGRVSVREGAWGAAGGSPALQAAPTLAHTRAVPPPRPPSRP